MSKDEISRPLTVQVDSLVGLPVETRIWFSEEKKPYRVRAVGDRFLVCTKPFNLKKTVFYTVVDLKKNIRGTENLVFCMGAETTEDCEEMIQRLESGETSVSGRNFISLNVLRIKKPNVEMRRGKRKLK